MTAIAADRPHFSLTEVTQLAQDLYGITTAAQELPSERDQNFHLQTESGDGFVFKISSAAEKRSILDLQHDALDHLGATVDDGVWPRVCRTKNNEPITSIPGANGKNHMVRMLTFIDGIPLVHTKPHSPELLNHLGSFLGRVSGVFEQFTHPEKQPDLKWNPDNGPDVLHTYAGHIAGQDHRDLVDHFCAEYEATVGPIRTSLRRSIIHNDANDHNVLVTKAKPNDLTDWKKQVAGLIDFGDMVESYTIAELAVAIAYVMLGKAEPLAAAAHVIRGYHASYPLTEQEVEVLFHFVVMRLCMSVCISADQQAEEPENEYLSVSENTAWPLLKKLSEVPPSLAHYIFREACEMSPCPQTPKIMAWLNANGGTFASVMGPGADITKALVFDLSVGSLDMALLDDRADVHAFTDLVFDQMKQAGAEVVIGRYNEARQIYASDLFTLDCDEMPERRTIHLGLDVFLPAGAPVYAPIDGIIHSFRNNTEPLDYGPCIILEHQVEKNVPTFYTLYGHLSLESLDGHFEGKQVKKGEQIATLGDHTVNGGWPPHIHFQIVTDMLGRKGEFPGVGAPSQRNIWLSIDPDPNTIIGVPSQAFPPPERTHEDIMEARQDHIGKSLSVSYGQPLKIQRGHMQYLYDEAGRAYLDAVNNVPHVGHSHPRVVRAGQRQMAVLNTNTRYLHDQLVKYAERLCATMPDPLSVCFFVNSGSEANDLALRLARNFTGRNDTLILDGAYHGNLSSLIDISPYKFDSSGGLGPPAHVHTLPMPDPYRGVYKGYGEDTGIRYGSHVREKIEELAAQERGICAFIAESLLGCGGQIVLPEGYFTEAFTHVRAAGGVCITDEVQVGFGRVGTHFWGFETQEVIPDIVTLGKPIGNGHPLGAVITTPAIADAFANGMEYFNTFGGNPVSCAIGLEVLSVIQEENLQEHARQVGDHLMDGLRHLMEAYPIIGDVRGLGLYIGAEMVLDRDTLEPAGDQASYVANRMKDHGVLISTDGPLHNVLKIKPPLVFNQENADYLLTCLDKILQEDFCNPS
jgi:4-aminobutyrate aminotransferase-like enzyme/Ser/Thr protein kinase RdoA (MazF antagonist)